MKNEKLEIPTADEWKNSLIKDDICNDTPEDINAFMTVAGAMFFGKNEDIVKAWLGKKYSKGFNTYWTNLSKGNVFSEDGRVIVTGEEKDIDVEYVLLGLLAKGFVTRTIENARVKHNIIKKSSKKKLIKKKSTRKK